jgi:hypothetical protein
MFFLSILAVIIVAILVLWIINTYLPFDGVLKKVFNTAVAIAILIWVLQSIDVL